MKQRKYLTKKLLRDIGDITNDTYESAVAKVTGLQPNLDPEAIDTEWDEMIFQLNLMRVGREPYNPKLYEIRDKIADEYLNLLIAHPTNILNDILFLHNKGRLKRADRTIEYIVSELARRSLFNDPA